MNKYIWYLYQQPNKQKKYLDQIDMLGIFDNFVDGFNNLKNPGNVLVRVVLNRYNPDEEEFQDWQSVAYCINDDKRLMYFNRNTLKWEII